MILSTDIREVERFLYREARLLDDLALNEWLSLFTENGLYWIPIDETQGPDAHPALVYDDAARREERVHHLLHLPFPAQNPRSRTIHVVTNVESEATESRPDLIIAHSVQIVYEVRTGDFTQLGLGHVRPLAARVRHDLVRVSSVGLRIVNKTVLLLDRDMPQSNLTFIF